MNAFVDLCVMIPAVLGISILVLVNFSRICNIRYLGPKRNFHNL